MSNDIAEVLPEGAVYFTTRKIKEGWIAERIYSQDGYWKREMINVPGGRAHAMEQCKIGLGRYWDSQRSLI